MGRTENNCAENNDIGNSPTDWSFISQGVWSESLSIYSTDMPVISREHG